MLNFVGGWEEEGEKGERVGGWFTDLGEESLSENVEGLAGRGEEDGHGSAGREGFVHLDLLGGWVGGWMDGWMEGRKAFE